MDLSALSDSELELGLVTLSGNEREVTLKILYHLIELEARGLYRDLGYSSLFDYCTRKLHYSGASAHRRIEAARCLMDIPELGDRFLKGSVTLCSIALAAKSLKAKETTVEAISGKSAREVEKLVLKEVPAKPRERLAPVIVAAPKTQLVELPRDERVSFKFSVPESVYQQFEEARALLSNTLGKELSAEAVFSKLIESYLSKPKAGTRRNLHTRHVPESLRREVYERDGGQCCYKSPDGTQCQARMHLEIDHIIPRARGGATVITNLRLLCPAHNKLLAEQHFGRGYIQGKIFDRSFPTLKVTLTSTH